MNYTIEKGIMVPMRDGVKLATDIYHPAEGGPFPTLLVRLPYNKELSSHLSNPLMDILVLLKAGYAIVLQDTRGTASSEGDTFVPVRAEPEDGADTIEWITKQSWSTGKIGTLGLSYLGFTQWLLARENPQGLAAMVPVVTTNNYYHTPWYQGGTFQLGCALNFSLAMTATEMMRRVGKGKASMVDLGPIMQGMANLLALLERLPLTNIPELEEAGAYYFDFLEHPSYDDYWKSIAHDEHYEQVKVPALNIGGWYDLFLGGTIKNYLGMKEKGGSENARRFQRLVIGPWSHIIYIGAFPGMNFGLSASAMAANIMGLQTRWFDHWVKNIDNGVEKDKSVKIFVMGLNQWREEEDWPLPDTKYSDYYLRSGGKANSLHGDGTLSTEAPTTVEKEDVYLYNPRRPVPTAGGAILFGNPLGTDAGPVDQRQVEERDDVLCYTTPPLQKAVEVTGPIQLVLYAASSAKDTDFTGKLVDVHPDGRAIILTDGILRARYRESFSEAKLMEPGEVYELHLDLWATSNQFKEGHSIRLEVSSSNFPRFNRNSNTGGEIAKESEQPIPRRLTGFITTRSIFLILYYP